MRPAGYLTPKCEAREVAGKGYGVFAVAPIAAGEIVTMWGGEVVPRDEFVQLADQDRSLSLQVADELYLVVHSVSPADRVNHSCHPNAGVKGQIMLVAMRDIAAGEEVCYDYAMTDGSAYDEFECQCGASECRKHITGEDWRLPELWTRYEGYFSAYLQTRIDRLRAAQNGHLEGTYAAS